MWFATIGVGMMVRSDLLGFTSIIRALNLRPKLYDPLRKHFHSKAIKLDQLAVLWTRVGAAAVLNSGAVQCPAGAGRGWHQDPQTREADAGRQAPASAIQLQHQARIHNGAFLAGDNPAHTRGFELLRRALALRIHEGLV